MNDISVISDIFTEEERNLFIKNIQPLLVSGEKFGYSDRSYPGKQTHPTLHLHLDFVDIHKILLIRIKEDVGLNLKIYKSWVNWTNGKVKEHWHNHPCSWTGVYYMKTFPFLNNGTLFESKFIRVPQNSLLLFPGDLMHTAPKFPFGLDRYTWAMEFEYHGQ
jgi:hypothetical protein